MVIKKTSGVELAAGFGEAVGAGEGCAQSPVRDDALARTRAAKNRIAIRFINASVSQGIDEEAVGSHAHAIN